MVVAGNVHAQQADAKRAAPARTAMPTMAFVDVAVIPMDRERVLPHQTVVVRGDRILALGPARRVRVPAAARRIDGRGKYLIPGLADMHAHMRPVGEVDTTVAALERWLYVYAANGVTTIRTMGYAPAGPHVLAARARAARGELISPRLYVAAGPLSVHRAADVILAKDSGYDLVKLHGADSPDGPMLDSIAATARRLGLPFAGHPPPDAGTAAGLPRALALGFASVEHLAGFDTYLGSRDWWAFWNDSTLSPAQAHQLLADTAKLRAIVADFKRTGVWSCPTLAMFDAPLVAADTWPELRYLRPEIEQEFHAKPYAFPRPTQRPTAEAAAVRRAIVKALQDGGVGLLLGTDTPVPYIVPGFSVHRELEALVRAGLTPYEALATGTRNVAAYFGTLDSTGTIALGKRADLVLLNGNPLQDIRHTMTPAGVMLGGRWLDRAALDRGLAAVEGQLWGFPPQS